MEGEDTTMITRGRAAIRRGEPKSDGPGRRLPETIKTRAGLNASHPFHGGRHIGRPHPRYAYLTDSHD
jgi:hypothetical protein